MFQRSLHTLLFLIALLGLLGGTGCAVNPVTGEADFVMLSEEEEIELGRNEHPNILKRYGQYSLRDLNAYVDKVGQRLAANSHRPHLQYHFQVLDSPEVNAFALPGGYIYITRGLLAYLNSEAELAAVLGHEIGHVTARHGVRQYSAAMATQLGYTLGSIFVPELRHATAKDLFNILGSALLSGYGREHELEADRLGAEYLARSDYDPQAMIQVIRVLKNQELFARQQAQDSGKEPQTYHGLFATHPDNDTRLKQVVGKANSLKTPGPRRVNRSEFLNHLNGLVFGQSEAQGILRGRNFYHKSLSFGLRFPERWEIHNRPDTLLALSPDKAALLQFWGLKAEKNLSPAQLLIKHFKLSKLNKASSLRIHGLDAYSATAQVKTSFGLRNSRLAVVYLDAMAYVFIGTIKQAGQLADYDKTFMQTIGSFHRLTAKEKSFANAYRIKLIRSKSDMHFNQLAKQSPLGPYAEEQLRLLNDKYPSGEPDKNQLLKIIK